MSRKPSNFARRFAGGGSVGGLFHPKSRLSPLLSIVLVFFVRSSTVCVFLCHKVKRLLMLKSCSDVILSGPRPCYWVFISGFRYIFHEI